MILKEKELDRVIKDNFYSQTILVEAKGIIQGKIRFFKADCQYNDENGILIIADLINKIKINLASQYRIKYEEKEKLIIIYLDNGQDIKLTVLEK